MGWDKPPGTVTLGGDGLGLDVARRRGGDLRVPARPGNTRFEVRLPTGTEGT